MARGKSGLPRPPSRGQVRSAAVNKGKQGAAMRARRPGNSVRPPTSSRGVAGGGDERGTVTNQIMSRRPTSANAAMRGVGAYKPRPSSGDGADIGKFARDVSGNFARGVAEAGRQIGSIKGPTLPSGPLSGDSLGRAVNAAKGKSWINR